MDEPRNPPSPLERERWLLGEQSDQERRRTEARLGPARMAALRAEDEALRAQLVRTLSPARFAARVRERASAGEREESPAPARSSWFFALPAALAVACALLVVVSTRTANVGAPTTTESGRASSTERAKGQQLALHVYRKVSTGVEQLTSDSKVRAGDVLQLGYVRAGHRFGMLLSIDGRGDVTLHLPHEGTRTTALAETSGESLLPDAYELDDAPDFERFVLVASDRPLAPDDILRAARELSQRPAQVMHAPLALPDGVLQRSVLLQKSNGP